MYSSIGSSELNKQNLLIGEELVCFYNKQHHFLVAWNVG